MYKKRVDWFAVFLFVGVLFIGCGKKSDPVPETPPAVSITNLSLFEGTGEGHTSFRIELRLSKRSNQEVSVVYNTVEGSAKETEDYVPQKNGRIIFSPGKTTAEIVVDVIADDIKEGDETFTVELSGATNASIQKQTAVVIIRNDDSKVFTAYEGYDAPATYPGYKLVWADEFNTATLNNNNWWNQNGNGCPDLCGWGNNELEYYTSRPQNIFFQEGKLIIEANKENYNNHAYTSSKILSAGKRVLKFGRVDFRARLPKGKGIWPAFWMMPEESKYGTWPRSGELDIMELVGHEPATVHGTVHYGPGPGSISRSFRHQLSEGDFSDRYHVFSLIWKEDYIEWLVDGVAYARITKQEMGNVQYPFNEAFHFIINLAVGGNWPGSPDNTTYFPAWMIADYVRVYQEA